MPTVAIEEKGCRGCTLCVDVCPVDVFEQESSKHVAMVRRQDDCIGCLSCVYACPSSCVSVGDVPLLRPFHRIEKNRALVERLLQAPSQQATVGADDWQEAQRDVGARLLALGGAVTETMGRGQRAVGRKAGGLAAAHLPEMYESSGLEQVLTRMRDSFAHAFDFDFKLSEGEDGPEVDITFHSCSLGSLVEGAGEKIGDAVLCALFHEYWSGLVGAFASARYRCAMSETGLSRCQMRLTTN